MSSSIILPSSFKTDYKSKELEKSSYSKSVSLVSAKGEPLAPLKDLNMTKADALRQLADRENCLGRTTFEQLPSHITNDPDFIKSVMKLGAFYFWCPNFPKSERNNPFYLTKALFFKHDFKDFDAISEEAKNHVFVINKFLKHDFLNAVRYYFGKDANSICRTYRKKDEEAKIKMEEFKLRDFLQSCVHKKSTCPRYWIHGNIKDSLVNDRRDWCQILSKTDNNLGLDIIFSQTDDDDIMDLIERIQSVNQFHNESDVFLVSVFKNIIRNRYEDLDWFQKFGAKLMLRNKQSKKKFLQIVNEKN